jgi:ribokinase
VSGRVIVVGSYNVGLTVVGSSLPAPGQTVLGHTFDMGPGGKGSNQAIGARRLGADVTLVAKVGNDAFGTAARELFEREGLLGPGILEAGTHTGVGLILVDEQGHNMIAVAPGANALLTPEDLDRVPGLFEGASHLLCQLECPPELFMAAARRARAVGATTILNPAPAVVLPDEAYALIDILTPNQTELAVLTGLDQEGGNHAEEAARILIERGTGEVIVTLGDRGVVRVTSQGGDRRPARKAPARDTTGAGDAFNAGLVAGLAADRPIEEALDLGIRAGAFCVTRLGVIDGLPTREQLDREVPA